MTAHFTIFFTCREDPILTISMESKDDLSIVHWSGDMTRPAMALETYKNSKIGQVLEFNHAIAINKAQTLCWVCLKTTHYIQLSADQTARLPFYGVKWPFSRGRGQ